MTRSIACLPVSFSLWLALAGTAAGQTMVEYGLGASRAATSAAPAKGLGKSMSGLAGSLDKALKGQPGADAKAAPATAAKPAVAAVTAPAAQTPQAAADTPPAPAPNWEDPSGIEPGLGYEDLVRRFGPSSMAITAGAEKSLTYRGKDGMFQVKVEDGAVTSIEKPRPKG